LKSTNEKNKFFCPSVVKKMKTKLIAQGAESKIFLEKDFIIKDRISKKYRHPELDKRIRKRRTKGESKLLTKASKIINSPKPKESTFDKIKMPYIDGKRLSISLEKFSIKKQKEIAKLIGQNLGKLHKNDIIHGDLTTSNMILKDNKIFFIDFGLGFVSRKVEDKAVDLHLLKEAFIAKHFKNWEILLKEVFKSYKKILGKTESKKIFERIKAIEKRRRYRH